MVPGRRSRSRRSTRSGSPPRRCRRLLPGSPRPSGRRHSGSGSRCRGLLDPEGDGSFEQITLHPQPGVVALQLGQPGPLIPGQTLTLATVDAVLLGPVAERGVVDAQLTRDLGDRSASGAHQLHGIMFERLCELPSGPLGLVGHLDSLLLSAVSCHQGDVKPPSAPTVGDTTTGPVLEVPQVMLVWTPGRLPPGFAARVGGMPGVRHAVPVVSGTVWLARSLDGDGHVVDRPPAGMAIPLDLAAAA